MRQEFSYCGHSCSLSLNLFLLRLISKLNKIKQNFQKVIDQDIPHFSLLPCEVLLIEEPTELPWYEGRQGGCVLWGQILCLERDRQSLGVRYTTASVKDKVFSLMAKNILKVLLPHEAPVNLSFHERTGALPITHQLSQCMAKITMTEVNKYRHLFPWYLTFH